MANKSHEQRQKQIHRAATMARRLDDGYASADRETGSGESGASGQSGAIEFRDFLATSQNLRDDQLSGEEKHRLLVVHKDVHELRVKKQKELRDSRKELKEGKVNLQDFRQEQGQGYAAERSQYKANPILAQSAQFSGSVDRQVNAVPTEFIAETNPEKQNELSYQYQLRHRPNYAPAPQFHPKPQFNG